MSNSLNHLELANNNIYSNQPTNLYQRHTEQNFHRQHLDTIHAGAGVAPSPRLQAHPTLPGYYSGSLKESNQAPPQEYVRMGDNIMTKLDFVYDYDLDKNGVFSYLMRQSPLGTNPAYPGATQSIKMFAPSVRTGYPESLIFPEENKDFKTMNQAFSYVGCELLGGKRLIPSCYTIRNCVGDLKHGDSRSESATTLLNWQFEASQDMISWQVLDKRIHYPEKHIMRGPPSKDVQQMTFKGALSTWGIDPDMIPPFERVNGYKYFRIV